MITKFLEAFFRHKLLVLLPPIVIPLIVDAVALHCAPAYGRLAPKLPSSVPSDRSLNFSLPVTAVRRDWFKPCGPVRAS